MKRCLTAAAITLALAGAAAACCDGWTEVELKHVPAIAKLHTCPPKGSSFGGWTDRGVGYVFAYECTRAPAGFVPLMKTVSAVEGGEFAGYALYIARDKNGRGARRLAFPFLHADGRLSKVELLPMTPGMGWSARKHVSGMDHHAFISPVDLPPAGKAHFMMSFKPLDRPHLCSATAIWLVTHRTVELIYWAELAECPKGPYPEFKSPHPEVKLDRRPER